MRGENFIYFATVSGFFIGIIFSILKDLGILDFLIATFLVTSLFYLISLAGVTFFVKYLDIKRIVFFDKFSIDEVLDMQIKELEKKEEFIYQNYQFLKEIEREELEIIRKKKHDKSL